MHLQPGVCEAYSVCLSCAGWGRAVAQGGINSEAKVTRAESWPRSAREGLLEQGWLLVVPSAGQGVEGPAAFPGTRVDQQCLGPAAAMGGSVWSWRGRTVYREVRGSQMEIGSESHSPPSGTLSAPPWGMRALSQQMKAGAGGTPTLYGNNSDQRTANTADLQATRPSRGSRSTYMEEAVLCMWRGGPHFH